MAQLVRKILSAGVISVLAAPVFAQDYVFECDMRTHGRGWHTSDVWIVGVSQEKGTGLIYNGNIKTAGKEPVLVKYTKRSDNKYRMRYSMMERFTNNSEGRIDYDVTLNLAKQTVMVSVAFPGEADNTGMGARGKCKPLK